MGGVQAAGTLALVKRQAMEKRGEAWSEAEEAAFRKDPRKRCSPNNPILFMPAARLWDDGIIDPRRSREVLGLSLATALNAPIEETRFGLFRM